MSTASSTTDQVPQSLPHLVARLPEVYQPIFAHPELSTTVSRPCDDRLEHLLSITRAMSQRLGRPLRILDIGCAQGYFSLHLAADGAHVTGVEILPANVAVCRALAAEHPTYDVRFEESSLEEFLATIQQDTYDVVLGLSIFHHLTHLYGIETMRGLFGMLAERIAVGIFEMARADEPPAWAASQPSDERTLLEPYAFVHELARIPTHLSQIKRPLFFASNRAWYVPGHFAFFDTWTTKAHAFVGESVQQVRRYFFNEDTLCKVYRHTGQFGHLNRNDLENEALFLASAASILPGAPRLFVSGTNGDYAWIVRERIAGDLLVDAIRQGRPYDPFRVISDVLEQLCILEKAGFYHTDLRTWNVILRYDGGASIIDFGSLSQVPCDQTWPKNLFLVFWTFVWSVVQHWAEHEIEPIPPLKLSPLHLPQPYRTWARACWRIPPNAWSFQSIQQLLHQQIEQQTEDNEILAIECWMTSIEEYIVALISKTQQNQTNAMVQLSEFLQRYLMAERPAATAAQPSELSTVYGETTVPNRTPSPIG